MLLSVLLSYWLVKVTWSTGSPKRKPKASRVCCVLPSHPSPKAPCLHWSHRARLFWRTGLTNTAMLLSAEFVCVWYCVFVGAPGHSIHYSCILSGPVWAASISDSDSVVWCSFVLSAPRSISSIPTCRRVKRETSVLPLCALMCTTVFHHPGSV